MTLHTKSTLVLAATLLLGIVFGVLLVGAIGQWRGGRQERIGRPGGFVEHLERVIQPRDEAQREAMRPILQATERRNFEIERGAHEQFRAAFQEMVERLEPLLDEEQLERLQNDARGPAPLDRPGDRPSPPGPGGRRPAPLKR